MTRRERRPPSSHGVCARPIAGRRSAPRLAAALLTAAAAGLLCGDLLAAEVTLAWDPVIDATGYKLYYTDVEPIQDPPQYNGTGANEGDSPVDFPLASLTDPDNPEVTLSGLPSCTLFYFVVTAYNTDGESEFSDQVTGTLIARPTVTLAAAGEGGLRVSWSPIPDDDDGAIPRYLLHYDTTSYPELDLEQPSPYSSPGSPVTVQTSSLPNPSAPSYVLTGLQAGTTYYVRVESKCDDDAGKYSEEAEGVTGDVGSGGAGTGGSGTGATGTGGSGTGNTGTGATGTGGSGTGATAGAPGSGADSSEDEGCGCATPGGATHGGAAALLAAAALAAGRRRRRSAR